MGVRAAGSESSERMSGTTKRPTRCETCGFSSRHTIQKPGEILQWMACCHAWMCAGCRDVRGCSGRSDTSEDPAVGLETNLQHQVPTRDGVWKRVPEKVYHADRTSLSSSGARTLLHETPAQFLSDQIDPPESKDVYDFGSAAHKYVLHEGAEIAEVEAENWRGKDAQIARRAARKEGKVPLLTEDVMKAKAMAAAVTKNQWAKMLLAEGTPEVSGYWRDPETGVRLRCRPDWITWVRGQLFCVDYKTSTTADPRKFMKSAADFGYHQQQPWYEEGLLRTDVGEARFVFIVQSKKPPYLTSVIELDSEAVDLGRRLNRRAVDIYAQCKATDSWPGYEDTVHTIGLPSYAHYQQEELLA